MSSCKVFCLFIFFILSSSILAQAAGERDLIIQKEMDCVDTHLQQNDGISWNDVCVVPESSYQGHQDIVNQQMDQIETNEVPQHDAQLPKKSDLLFEIAPEVSYIRYHEPTVMKETGIMSGLNGTFTFRPPEGNYLNTEMTDVYRFEGRFSYGKVNFSGNIFDVNNLNAIPNTFNGISDYMVEIRTLIGKDYNFNNDSIRLTPFSGGGYRSLLDASFVDKPFGVDRHSQYLYVPAGVELMTKLTDGWSIAVDGEYDYLIRCYLRSSYNELGFAQSNKTQSAGYGMRGSIKLVKSGKSFNLIFEPFVRYWDIHGSKAGEDASMDSLQFGLSTLKPDNNSLEIGGRLGIEF